MSNKVGISPTLARIVEIDWVDSRQNVLYCKPWFLASKYKCPLHKLRYWRPPDKNNNVDKAINKTCLIQQPLFGILLIMIK
jgi:hypothetical protein